MTIGQKILDDWLDGLHTQATARSAALWEAYEDGDIVENENGNLTFTFPDGSVLAFPLTTDMEVTIKTRSDVATYIG